MEMIVDFLIWILLWLIGFGLFNFLRKKGMNYTGKPLLVSVYFLVFTGITILYFYKGVFLLNTLFSTVALTVLFLTYVVAFLTYYLSRKYMQKPTRFIEKYNDQYFIKMDYRYLISKSFDILFQQTLIFILVILLSERGIALSKIVLAFVLVFGIIHVVNIPVAGRFFGIYYFITSVIGAFLFPILILKVAGGLVYSYILHFFFYTLSAVLFWVYAQKLEKIM